MEIVTVATLSKSLSIKREKSEEGEAVIAHLKFTDAVVRREEMDEIVGVLAWSRRALFDELGAPIARLEISLLNRELAASLKITGDRDRTEMHVTQGILSAITLTLADSGALLAGTLSWPVAGDEVSDLEPLLGKLVRLEGSLSDGGQGDLLKSAA